MGHLSHISRTFTFDFDSPDISLYSFVFVPPLHLGTIPYVIQLWELNKKDELVTKKDPHGCLYVDDNELGELVKYDDDCSSSRYHSKWKVTSSNQIQLKTDSEFCITFDAPSWSSPDNKDKCILRYCKDIDRFKYDFVEK